MVVLGLGALLLATLTLMWMEERAMAMTNENAEVNLDHLDEFAKIASLQERVESMRERVLAEYGLSGDEEFSSWETFQEIIGHQCSPLRHCGHKIMDGEVYFFGGGLWNASISKPSFSPYPCWMYQVQGSEPWITAMLEAGHLAILMDIGDANGDDFKADNRFMRLKAAFPRSAADETSMRAQVIGAIGSASIKISRLTLVVRWHETFADKQSAVAASRVMVRLANRLPVSSTEVLWVNQAFRAASLDADVESNELVTSALKSVSTSELQPPSYKAIGKEEIVASQLRVLAGSEKETFQLSADEMLERFHSDDDASVLFVNTGTQESEMRFGTDIAIELGRARAVQGWTPNVHSETTIVLAGPDAQHVRASLQRAGFSNVWTAEGQGLLDAARRLESEGKVIDLRATSVLMGGLDVFGPSLAAPRDANPLAFAHIFLENAVWNVMMRKYIMMSSSSRGADHICAVKEDCSPCTPVLGEIPSSRVTKKLLLEYLRERSTPNKIALLESEHVYKGTWASLVARNGDAKLKVRSNYLRIKTRRFTTLTLRTYLRNTGMYVGEGRGERTAGEAALPAYAGNNHLLPKDMAKFNFKYPSWLSVAQMQRPSLWLGPARSMSPIHVDHANGGNLAYQVFGAKTWVLFPPSADPLMYLRNAKAPVVWSALDNPWAYENSQPAMEAYPDFRYAFCLSVPVDLRAGEVLFNPYGWWHAVRNDENSLMLNFWIKAQIVDL
ncbi:Lysine-specific demethylase 8 [Hondaea fermentalgiana]|uniref:Lysine-specific demethylase 8 n=1 Tax=Hondaea fermentalgiana TaxID=2315210 RepID=A0A2R5GTA9_9STRA|nr:Lysine-specific demethylase 8 [Hondaea fermentalgiana]|eukprot:GBG33559.1 Lysine-specific demethylase 8 [Hondaea fermentalgiana]